MPSLCCFADQGVTERSKWALEVVSSTVKSLTGLSLSVDAPLMSAGLDSLGQISIWKPWRNFTEIIPIPRLQAGFQA